MAVFSGNPRPAEHKMAFIGSSYREIELICIVKLTETGVWPSSPLDLPYLFAATQPGNILLQNSSGLPEKNFLSSRNDAFLTTVREHLRDRFKIYTRACASANLNANRLRVTTKGKVIISVSGRVVLMMLSMITGNRKWIVR